MQKIYFKKLIDLNHQLKELISISVDESISYKAETQGIRAVGSIMINGEYKDDNNKHQFQETIDLDLFALFEKITDKREFHVKVEDFDYHLTEGNLSMVIQACVYGVLDDEDRMIEASQTKKEDEQTVIDSSVEEIEKLLREEDQVIENDNVIVQKTPLQEVPSQVKKTKAQESMTLQEDIQDDEEDLGVYYFYVVQEGDSYQSIAARYQIDEYQLKDYNHDRALSQGSIVIVPYII